MNYAWYICDDEKKRVKAHWISQSEYQEKYKGNLYCFYNGCPAKMVLVEQQKKEYMRYFRRLQGSKHKKGCPYDTGESSGGGYGTSGNKIMVGLTEEHAKKILNGAYNIAIGKKKPRKPKSSNNKNNRKKVDEQNQKIEVTNNALSPGGKGGHIKKGRKQPPAYKKSVSDILVCKNNETYCVYGEIKNFDLKDDEASIIIEDTFKKTFKIYFGNAFIINNEQDFKYLKFFKKYSEVCKAKGEKAICTCICFKKKQGEEIIGEILDIDYIRINDRGLVKVWNIIKHNYNAQN